MYANGKGVPKEEAKAVEWYQKAAAQGEADAQCFVGCCYAQGLGTAKNFDEARKWLGLAAAQGAPNARYRLRLLFFEKHSILKWRYACITAAGYALLIVHCVRVPISISGFAIAAFLIILSATAVVFVAAVVALEKFGVEALDEKETGEVKERIFSWLKREPWRFLLIPAEDGFFLLPLLYIGINPTSAAVAGFLFAAAHYPLYPWRYCVPKGIAYFFVALFILPYGIWSVVVAHLFLDVAVFVLLLLARLEGKPTWQQLLRALRTE